VPAVWKWLGENVCHVPAKLLDALVKVSIPLQLLLSLSAVDDAAVTVIELPALSVAPLMVPTEPVRRLVLIEVVETICPLGLTPSNAFERPVSQIVPADKRVEVAFAKDWSFAHVFWSESSVEDAAVTVMFAVPLNETPFMVRVF